MGPSWASWEGRGDVGISYPSSERLRAASTHDLHASIDGKCVLAANPTNTSSRRLRKPDHRRERGKVTSHTINLFKVTSHTTYETEWRALWQDPDLCASAEPAAASHLSMLVVSSPMPSSMVPKRERESLRPEGRNGYG